MAQDFALTGATKLQELEGLVCRSMSEVLAAKAETAEVRRKCADLEGAADRLIKRAQALRKQNQDLTAVVRKYVTDRAGGRETATPVKITRSVGLTVQLPPATTAVVATVDARRKPAATVSSRAAAEATTSSQQSLTDVPVRGIPQKGIQVPIASRVSATAVVIENCLPGVISCDVSQPSFSTPAVRQHTHPPPSGPPCPRTAAGAEYGHHHH